VDDQNKSGYSCDCSMKKLINFFYNSGSKDDNLAFLKKNFRKVFNFSKIFTKHTFNYLPKYRTNDDFRIIANTSKTSSPSVLHEYLNGITNNVAINDKKNTTLKGLNIKVCK
jgi:hypothetical protein